MKTDWLSWGAVLALSIIWGGSFALIEVALAAGEPAALAFARAALALIVLAGFAVLTGQEFPKSRSHWLWSGAIGITSLALPFTLIFWAQQTLPSSVIAAIIATIPLFVLLNTRIFLKEPIQPSQWVGFTIGVAGLIAVTGVDAVAGIFEAPPLPQLAALGAAISYGITGVIVRKGPAIAPVPATAASFMVACVLLAPFGAESLAAALPSAPPSALIALVVLGVLQTGLAQLLRFWAVRRAGPVFMSTTSYLIPVWAGLFGVVFLSEYPTSEALIGFALILAGLFTAQNKPQAVRAASASNAG